jgi:hypothetical protein
VVEHLSSKDGALNLSASTAAFIHIYTHTYIKHFLKTHKIKTLGAGQVAPVNSSCLASTRPEFNPYYCLNKQK